MPTLRRMLFVTAPMMRGDDVLMVQHQLCASGGGPTQDGLYGEGTATAVRVFQRAHNLDADGIVGHATWQALLGDATAGTAALPPDPLSADNLAFLGTVHGYYKDGCRWRLGGGGIEVEGETLATPGTADRVQAASVMTRFRQELVAALATYRLPVELVVACICAGSAGRPEAVVMEPGCDRNNPENTPTQVSVGLMQLYLATARTLLRQPQLRLAELQRPDIAILAGAGYMDQQTSETHCDPPLVAAAYDTGALRYNADDANRWRLLQYPIGTSGYVDRFIRFFNAATAAVDTISWPDHVPVLAHLLRGGVTALSTVRLNPTAPIVVVTSSAPSRADIAQAIRAAAGEFGADADTLGAMAFIESGLRIDAHAPTSTAFGLFQFLDATWDDVVHQHGAACDVTVADRRNLRAQCMMGAAFLQDNVKMLEKTLSRKPQAAECYAAHFFGAGTAARLLAGGPGVRADTALGDNAKNVIDANQPIFLSAGRTRTVGEVMELFESKMMKALAQARDLFAGAPRVAIPEAAHDQDAKPAWLVAADQEMGQREVSGAADNAG